MRRLPIFLLSLFFLFFLSGCWFGPGFAGWTFLVYMAADNNLDPYAGLDLQEMMAVGSTPGVRVIVQYDPASFGHPTKRYRVTKGNLVELASLGETNTGDPTVLEDFLTWGLRNFPARRYALVLWNHGSGIYDNFPSSTGKAASKGLLSPSPAVAVDDTSGQDALTTREYALALERAAQAGKPLELVCFDACYMAMAEVAAELAPFTRYLVASEEAVPGNGLDYKAVLSWLAAHPGTDGATLAAFIVESYAATYASSWSGGVISCALDLTGERWTTFLTRIGELAKAVYNGDEGLRTAAGAAAGEAYSIIDYSYPVNRDLGDFLRRLKEKTATSYPAVSLLAGEVEELLLPGGGVILKVASTGPLAAENLGGLAVFLPLSAASLAEYPDYSRLRFAVETGWDKLISSLASP